MKCEKEFMMRLVTDKEPFDKAASAILEQRALKPLIDRLMNENRKIAIWGAGDCGHHVYDVFSEQGVSIACFADNRRGGETDSATGVKIMNADTICRDCKDYCILVSIVNETAYHAVYGQLKEAGFTDGQLWDMRAYIERLPVSYFNKNRDKYWQAYSMLADDFSKKVYLERMKRVYLLHDISEIVSPPSQEYFDEVNVLTDKEVFVDCGGYDGDTSLRFIEKVQGKYGKIIIFEPEPCKKEAIEENLRGERYQLYPYGVWDKDTELCFEARGDVASRVSDKGSGDKVRVVTLDDYVYHEKPTFIKMDIEGSELPALIGGKKTIQTYKPKLAVCLYHKPQDLFEIPLYIKSLNPEYRLYIRQYANSKYETVCYAIPC